MLEAFRLRFGFRFGVQGSGFRVQGLGFRLFWVWGVGFRVFL